MQIAHHAGPDPWWRQSISEWFDLWGVPQLESRLTIRVSSRLRTSLARCLLDRPEIRIAAFLMEAPRPLLSEVLCHEAAHAAVVELHGRRVPPHGDQWRVLMRRAGFEPRARLPAGSIPLPVQTARTRALWEHRCPVCQIRRIAGRPVRRWRCAECCAVGLAGQLLIQRVTQRSAV